MIPFLRILAIVCLAGATAFADITVKAGPRNGRMLDLGDRSAEFFVEKDRTISIAFYDAAGKRQAPSGEVIVAIAEAPGAKTRLEFEEKDDLLVSKSSLPPGDGYQVVVQARTTAEAKPKNFRIKLETYICKECGNPEYACTCDE